MLQKMKLTARSGSKNIDILARKFSVVEPTKLDCLLQNILDMNNSKSMLPVSKFENQLLFIRFRPFITHLEKALASVATLWRLKKANFVARCSLSGGEKWPIFFTCPPPKKKRRSWSHWSSGVITHKLNFLGRKKNHQVVSFLSAQAKALRVTRKG